MDEKILLRIPPELKARLEAVAKTLNVSMNTLILFYVQYGLENDAINRSLLFILNRRRSRRS
jgi:predicted DNA-binding protein